MNARYIAQFLGAWMIEAAWFDAAWAAFRTGSFTSKGHALWDEPASTPGAETVKVKDADGYTVYSYEMINGTASIPILGQMQKGDSSLGGTSTVRVRQAIRQAAADPAVRSILLRIDSPGGTVAGTAELAADVATANTIKPVYAQIEDMGASAAYWVASQSRKVFANSTAMVGSLGTVLYVEDSSGAAEAAGIKVHPIATGPYKATGAEGTEVTPEQLTYLQGLVDDLNSHFKAGVQAGRGMSMADVNTLFDGRVHVAKQAKSLGLIDAVQSMDATMEMIQGKHAAEDAQRASRSNRAKAQTKISGMDLDMNP